MSRKETRTLQHVKRVKIEESNEREDQRGVKGASAAAASVQHALEVPVSVAASRRCEERDPSQGRSGWREGGEYMCCLHCIRT